MRKFAFTASVAACALTATCVMADGLFLDFEDPDLGTGFAPVNNPYHGTTWNLANGDGLNGLGVLDVPSYNTTYGANLTAISGDQVGWNRFGEDNLTGDLGGNYIGKSVYITPWSTFGPPSLDIEMYKDNKLVAIVNSGNLVMDQWNFVDLGGHEFDTIVFSNNGGGTWWFMDDLVLNKVPAPGAIALLGLVGFVARRRRRS